MTTLAAVTFLFIGALTGIWVGASARLWRRILRYVRRRQNRLPWHSLRGGDAVPPGREEAAAMNRTDRRILAALRQGPLAADDLATLTGRTRPTVLRATRRMWLRLEVNREPILTGKGGRPRLRYLLGIGAGVLVQEGQAKP